MSDFSRAAPFLQKQTLLCALENSKLAKLSKKLLPGVNVTRYRSGKRGAGLTCSHRTPAVTYSEMWGEFMKSLRSTSARKKRKSSLVQKGIYSTSGFLPHRSHLSCRAPVTFLLLLKPDWCCRGCCALLDKRGGDAKADVFQSCYAQTPPAAESSYKTAGQMKCSKPSHIPALTTFWCPALNLRLRVELHSTCFWSHALKDSFHFEQCAGVAGSSAGFVYMHQNLQFFLWKNSSL